jgi:hypothetical protein
VKAWTSLAAPIPSRGGPLTLDSTNLRFNESAGLRGSTGFSRPLGVVCQVFIYEYGGRPAGRQPAKSRNPANLPTMCHRRSPARRGPWASVLNHNQTKGTTMTGDYMAELKGASQRAKVNAEIAESYLCAAHDEADPAEASVKAQLGIGHALLAVGHELRAGVILTNPSDERTP